MVLLILMYAVQIALVVDVVRNGRNQIWIMALVFLPMVSTIAYLIVEVLPRFRYNQHVRGAAEQIGAKLHPERELKAARDQLDIAQTAANRLRLADAYTDLGRHSEALPLYRDAIGHGKPDLSTGERYARSLFQNDRPTEAMAVLDEMKQPSASGDRDRIALLRARILEELGERRQAEALYEDLVNRYPGDEVRCRYAALLVADGRDGEARALLEEVEARARRLTRQQRSGQNAMYDWAAKELARLRTTATA
jgi:hypothetical protein